jgi:hypothetical protein
MGAIADGPPGEPAELGAAVCAALREETGTADDLFVRVAERARRAGLRLAGALQRDQPRKGRSRCEMFLFDLASGRRIRISEDRGDLAQGCRLDPSALTEAAELIERAIRSAPPDLVILNKFGKAEAEEGGGLRGAIVAALEADIPVLIGVAAPYAAALREFAGDLCALAADEAAVWRWLRARLGERARFGERERIAPWPKRSRDNRGDAPWRITGYSASPRFIRPCRS